MFLLLAVIFALGVAYFATQNVVLVTLHLGSYTFSHIPLYIVLGISLFIGMFITWSFDLIGAASSFFALRGKDASLKRARMHMVTLEKRIQQLESENLQLKNNKEVVQEKPEVEKEQKKYYPNPFFPNLTSVVR